MVPSSPFASGDAVRRVLPFVLFVLTVLAPTFSFAAMEGETDLSDKSLLMRNRQEDETVLRVRSLLMTMRVDGKQAGKDMVVDISIEKTNGVYIATWDAVKISSVELANEVKRTHLRAIHYGTDSGNIRNIVVKDKFITFDIVRSHGDMKVEIFRTGEVGLDLEIKAYGTHYSNKKQRKFTEEWVMTNDIKLPSKEIFGYPEKKPRKRH